MVIEGRKVVVKSKNARIVIVIPASKENINRGQINYRHLCFDPIFVVRAKEQKSN